jgi:hypothetical protein
MNDLDRAVKEKWENNIVAVVSALGNFNKGRCCKAEIKSFSIGKCPYCTKYSLPDMSHDEACLECPVYKVMKIQSCENTGFYAVYDAYYSLAHRGVTKLRLELLAIETGLFIDFLETVYEKD